MNKQIKELMYILNESVFDSDLFDINDESLIDDDIYMQQYYANIYTLMIPILGTDKPRGWKKVKDEDNKDILMYEHSGWASAINAGKYVTNVTNLLEQHNYKKYHNTSFPIATMYKYKSLTDWEKSRHFPELYKTNNYPYRFNHKFTTVQQNKYAEQYKIFQTYPDMIKDMFYNDDTIKIIYMSPDNGIVCLIKDFIETEEYYTKHVSDRIIAIIKLTGKVQYGDMTSDDRQKLLDDKKIFNKKISILKSKYNASTYFSIYDLDSEGYPYSIYYFNWKDEVNKLPAVRKKFQIPELIYYLYKYKKFQPVQKYDYDDPNSIMELTRDSIIIKIYKDIPNAPSGKDSCMKLELTGYLKEHYKNLYLTNKKK